MFNHPQAVISATNERQEEKHKLLAVLQELNLLSEPCDAHASTYPEVAERLQRAVIEFLAMTPAKLFLIDQADLFQETEQQNLPGTTWQYPNWSLKMKYTVEQLRSDPEALAFANMFRNIVRKSGRNRPVI
jgi:4-alpha-glucanotransferase